MKKPRQFVKTLLTIMKISFLPLFFVMLTFGFSIAKNTYGQELLSRRITLRVNNQELVKVLTKIEKSANVKFSFVPQMISPNDKVSVSVKEEPLESVLNQILKPLHVDYEVAGKYIVLTKNVTLLEELSIRNFQISK